MPRICFNLTFDDATEYAVRNMWQRIADAGVAVRGLTGYRPHITLAVYDVADIAAYETGLVLVAAAMTLFPIHMDSLGIFPETGVVFLAPRMSHTLFSLHRAVLQALDGPDKPSVIAEHLLPDLWVPHCTLAGRLTPQQLLTAIDTCQRDWAPIRGYAEGIGMRIYPAPDDHRYYPFSHLPGEQLSHGET